MVRETLLGDKPLIGDRSENLHSQLRFRGILIIEKTGGERWATERPKQNRRYNGGAHPSASFPF